MDYSNTIEKIKEDLKNIYFVNNKETLDHTLRIANEFVFEDLNLSTYAPFLIVALLHDVVEDCKGESFASIQNKYELPNNIMEALNAITRRSGEEYFDYIDRVNTNVMAKRVKKMDLLDNIHRNPHDHNFDSLRKRYRKAFKILS